MKMKITNNHTVNKKLIEDIRVRDTLLRISDVECGTNPKKSVLYFGLKLSLLGVVVSVLAFGLTSIGGTVSFYKNIEKSVANFMQADPLSFSVEVASSTLARVDLSQTNNSITPVMTPDDDSENIQYFVEAKFVGGDSQLCNAIRLFSTYPFPYDNQLLSLKTATTTDIGAWTLSFSVSDLSLFSNTTCVVELVYSGWNADVPFGRGYNDKNKISITFFVPERKVLAPVVNLIQTDTGTITEEDNLKQEDDKAVEETIIPEEKVEPDVSPNVIQEEEVIEEEKILEQEPQPEEIEETSPEVIETPPEQEVEPLPVETPITPTAGETPIA